MDQYSKECQGQGKVLQLKAILCVPVSGNW